MLGYVLFLKLEKEEEIGQKVVRFAISVPTGFRCPPYFHRLCACWTLVVSQDLGLDLLLCILSSSNFLPNLHLGHLQIIDYLASNGVGLAGTVINGALAPQENLDCLFGVLGTALDRLAHTGIFHDCP